MPHTWSTPSLSKVPATATGRGSSTTYTGPVSRRRQSSSVNACSRSSVEPNASGESASERSRMSRKSSQSSGPSRRGSLIADPQDAGGADVLEAHAAVDARGRVVAGAQEHRRHAGRAAGPHQTAGDGGARPASAQRRGDADAHELGGLAPR